MFVRRSSSPPPRHRGPRGPLRRPDAIRPSGTLHRSTVRGPSRRRRLAQAGIGGAFGVAAAGGLAAILATSATAAPAAVVVAPASGSLVDGIAARSNAELVSYTAAQHAAAVKAAVAKAAAAQAAQQAAAKAAADRAAAASRSQVRHALSSTGGSFSGEASWYGPGFVGHRTSSGEPYNPDELTAASKTLRLGSHLRVCYHDRCVTVLINDRGPYVAGRILDLSEAAAEDIGLKSAGVGYVTATPVG